MIEGVREGARLNGNMIYCCGLGLCLGLSLSLRLSIDLGGPSLWAIVGQFSKCARGLKNFHESSEVYGPTAIGSWGRGKAGRKARGKSKNEKNEKRLVGLEIYLSMLCELLEKAN